MSTPKSTPRVLRAADLRAGATAQSLVGDAELEGGICDEEEMLYFLIKNEFYAGGTCTLTPHRVVRRSLGGELEPRLLRSPTESRVASPPASAVSTPARPPTAGGFHRWPVMPPQLPSRSELLDLSSDDSDDGLLRPQPRAAALPPPPRFDDIDPLGSWAARRWQPAPATGEVRAASEALLLAEALRLRHRAALRRGLRALGAWYRRPGRHNPSVAAWHWRHGAAAAAWRTWRAATSRAARAARQLRRRRASLLSAALARWREERLRGAQARLLLLSDTFRRLWVHVQTQKLARQIEAEPWEEIRLCYERTPEPERAERRPPLG